VSVLSLCAREFATKHPEEAARVVGQEPAADTQLLLGELPANIAAAVLSKMSLTAAAEALSLVCPGHAAAVTTELPPGNAALLLRRLDPELHSSLFAALSEDLRDQLNRLLEYPNGTVGAVTDPEVLVIPEDLYADAAQRLIRRRKATVHHQLYVVDGSRRLLGYLHVRDLVRASPKASIIDVMQPATVQVLVSSRLASIVSHPAWRDLDASPWWIRQESCSVF